MRLDKFVGKANYNTRISICNWETTEEIDYLPDGELYPDLKEKLKQYKVKSFEVGEDIIYVYVKKKED